MKSHAHLGFGHFEKYGPGKLSWPHSEKESHVELILWADFGEDDLIFIFQIILMLSEKYLRTFSKLDKKFVFLLMYSK